MSPCVRAPPPRICRPRASRDSRRPISTCSGLPALLEACRKCFASLFTDRAISYRAEHGFDHDKVYLSIGVQKMVRSDLAGSGVMFTLDTESGFDQVVFITAIYGLGENIVQGVANPDEYLVFKPTMAEISRRLGSKEIAMVYDPGGGRGTRNVAVPEALRRQYVLAPEEVLELARYGVAIEAHYTQRAGERRPMDIEWAKDGRTRQLFILQARPETAHARRDLARLTTFTLERRGPVLVTGRAVGTQIGAGPVVRLDSAAEMHRFRPGSVLVTAMTDPDWEPILKHAAAIVTDRGGRTCHAAIVSRELGIPCVVGTGNATVALRDGQPVTVSCAEGETGLVMDGRAAVRQAGAATRRAAGDADEDLHQRRQSRSGVQSLVPAGGRRRPRARGVHHRAAHRHPPDGARASRAHRRRDPARDRGANARLRRARRRSSSTASPRASRGSPPPSTRGRSSSGSPTSRPTSTPACSAGSSSSRTRRIR